jgi:hypothetical protein
MALKKVDLLKKIAEEELTGEEKKLAEMLEVEIDRWLEDHFSGDESQITIFTDNFSSLSKINLRSINCRVVRALRKKYCTGEENWREMNFQFTIWTGRLVLITLR